MIKSVNGKFVIVDANTVSPSYFWNGEQLTEVVGATFHSYGGLFLVRLKVHDMTNFYDVYAQMVSAGIKIQKKH